MRYQQLLLIIILLTVSCFPALAGAAPARRYARRVVATYPPYVTAYSTPSVAHSVPFHRQDRPLSCEAATLRMVLLFKGVDIPEQELQEAMLILPMDGDPNNGFVGDVDGVQHATGYGIHWNGLAAVANRYRASESFVGANLHFLIDRLNEGDPVIVWGSIYRNPRDRSWTTPDGTFIPSVQGEHTWVVTGFSGSERAPTHILTLDPIYGKRVFRTQDFLNLWHHFGNSGVVVH